MEERDLCDQGRKSGDGFGFAGTRRLKNCHNLAVPVLDKSMSAIAVDGQTARGPQEAFRRGGREREKRVSGILQKQE